MSTARSNGVRFSTGFFRSSGSFFPFFSLFRYAATIEPRLLWPVSAFHAASLLPSAASSRVPSTPLALLSPALGLSLSAFAVSALLWMVEQWVVWSLSFNNHMIYSAYT